MRAFYNTAGLRLLAIGIDSPESIDLSAVSVAPCERTVRVLLAAMRVGPRKCIDVQGVEIREAV